MRLFRLALGLLLCALPPTARAEVRGNPDVLVIGDSQLSFGAGVAFVDALTAMAGTCGLEAGSSVGVIGVRSSALTSWTGTTRRAKGAICDVDRKWRVNAGVYGTLSQGASPFVQIGQGDQFQLCKPGQSPLQAMFADGYYAPRLLILFLLGNAADRWADSPDAALADVRALMADLPSGQACVFVTSAPPFGAALTEKRKVAQTNIARAFAATGQRCSFVPGLTPDTIAMNTGRASSFRRNGSGRVKDPFHPTEAAARRFLDNRKPALCEAISRQMMRH